jgi:hypothetical protein
MSAATIAMIAERDAGLLSQVTVPGLREWYLEKEAEEFERSSPAYIANVEQENVVLKAEITALKAQVMFLNAQRIVLLSKYEPTSIPGKDSAAEGAVEGDDAADEMKEKED